MKNKFLSVPFVLPAIVLSIGLILVFFIDLLVSATLAAESSASVYTTRDAQGRSESVISLTRGADATVYALHTSRSFLHFFLSAFLYQ